MAFFSLRLRPIEIPEPIEKEIVYDEKEQPPYEFPVEEAPAPVREREYCSACLDSDGVIICPRRHRCKTCKCYLTDDEWFLQK